MIAAVTDPRDANGFQGARGYEAVRGGGRMVLSLHKIEALAPDQASLDAARKLLKPSVWPTLACDAAGLAWGEAQGSGATPYRVVIAEADAGYKCTCPSRKFPCKHVLALMWMRAESRVAFQPATPPGWVNEWLARRRGSSGSATLEPPPPKASIAAALEAEAAPAAEAPDPKAEARAVAQRERNRAAREASILAGLDELDIWLSDQIERGIAAFLQNPAGACRQMAQRLVDAKASGLATRLDSLPSRLLALPEASRPSAAVEELGLFHLMAEAYRRQETLEPALREDVRQMIGWSVARDDLLADTGAVRARGRWHVVATRSEVQPDRLRRTETWLWREAAAEGPVFALLLDFVPVTAGATVAGFAVGDTFEAELVYYASPVPLRALVAERSGPTETRTGLPDPSDVDLAAACASYERALAARPWLGDWPITFRDAAVMRSGAGLYLADPAHPSLALPLVEDQAVSALMLTVAGRVGGFAITDGRRVRLSVLATELGRWVDA